MSHFEESYFFKEINNNYIYKINNPKLAGKKKNLVNNKIIKEIKVKKERNPGIDLLRIIGMYAIIIHHIIDFSKVNTFKYIELRFMNVLCFFHISVYGFISGIVGMNSHKYSNLLFIWFSTFFYSLGFYSIYKLFYSSHFKNEELIKFIFPVIYKRYWYISSYFGMYLFLPVINKGISILSKLEHKIIIFSLIYIFTVWKDYFSPNNDPFLLNNGYSPIGLLIYYIIGSYLGKYIIIKNSNIMINFIYLILYVFSSYLCYYFSCYNKINVNVIIIKLKNVFTLRINSIPMYIQGISLTLIFSRIKYNKYIGKFITFIGPLSLGVYLIHCNYFVLRHKIYSFGLNYPLNISLKALIFLILLYGMKVLVFSMIIDYFKNLFPCFAWLFGCILFFSIFNPYHNSL